MSDYFQHEITKGIAAIRLNRPDKLNAINHEMWLELKELVDGAQKNKDVKALFLFSTNPKFFSTGADMDEFERLSGDKKWRAANFKAIRGAMDAVTFFPKPTVAGISGLCLGSGLGLAASCDIRYAELSSQFSLPPAKIGLVYPLPEVKRLVDLIGRSQAAEMLFTSRQINAKAARAIGLVTKVFAFDEYEKQLNLLAGHMSVFQPTSLMGIKHMLLKVDGGQNKDNKETEQLFLKAYDSEHFKNTMSMMRQKSNRMKGVDPEGSEEKPSSQIKAKLTPAKKTKSKEAPKPKTKTKPKKTAAKTKSPAKSKPPAKAKAAAKPKTTTKPKGKAAAKPKAKPRPKAKPKPKAKSKTAKKKPAKKKAAKSKAKPKGKKS